MREFQTVSRGLLGSPWERSGPSPQGKVEANAWCGGQSPTLIRAASFSILHIRIMHEILF